MGKSRVLTCALLPSPCCWLLQALRMRSQQTVQLRPRNPHLRPPLLKTKLLKGSSTMRLPRASKSWRTKNSHAPKPSGRRSCVASALDARGWVFVPGEARDVRRWELRHSEMPSPCRPGSAIPMRVRGVNGTYANPRDPSWGWLTTIEPPLHAATCGRGVMRAPSKFGRCCPADAHTVLAAVGVEDSQTCMSGVSSVGRRPLRAGGPSS